MSSSTPAATGQEAAYIASDRTVNICLFTITGTHRLMHAYGTPRKINLVLRSLLAYDIALTLGREYQYIWRSPKGWTSRVLYVWNRYLVLLYNILDIGTTASVSDNSCVALLWPAVSVQYLALLGPAMFTTLRIYALSGKKRTLGGVALVLSLVPFAINVSFMHRNRPTNQPGPNNCGFTNNISQNLYMGDHRVPELPDPGRLVGGGRDLVPSTLRKGAEDEYNPATFLGTSDVASCALVSMNLVDMVLVVLSVAITELGDGAYLILFIDPISSILNSRFLLALHETNARLEGASSSISSLSLHVDSGGEPKDLALPEFLAAVGGPIYPFPEHNNFETLDIALPLQGGESEAEPEGWVWSEVVVDAAEIELA